MGQVLRGCATMTEAIRRAKQDVVSMSDRQPVLLSQALVERRLGDEAA